MTKVIGFELKKLISRIGIYILVVLMAGVLVSGVFMYKPTERSIDTKALFGDTVSEMYNDFNNNLKQGYIDDVNNVAINANTYISTSSSYMKYNSKAEIDKLFNDFDSYCLLYSETSTATAPDYPTLLVAIRENLTKLRTALDAGLKPCNDNTGYYILTTKQNYTNLYTIINKIDINFASPYNHSLAGEKYVNEYREVLYNCLQMLVYPNLSSTAQKYAVGGSYYTLTQSRMDEIAFKMEQEYQKVALEPTLELDNTIKQELNALFNRYVNCADVFVKAYDSAICVQALGTINSKTDRSNLFGYGDVSIYRQEELASQYQYYIEHNASPSDFANSLSVSHTSNGKINAYDFTFFIMSIFTILVVLFAIYLSSHTISGEINNNTMRFTAIRPIKRSSIFLGKYFAILIMSFILLAFGTITSLCVGGILYGINSSNILMVVNGGTVIVAHPAVVIGIFMLSNFLILALYSALTMLFSAMFKSDLLAMIISVAFYAVNLILPLFFGQASWLRFYPFVNINLFAYFSSTRIASDSVLSQLFNSVVYNGMNIWISLVYIFGITALLVLIGKLIFRKREL